MEADIFTPDDVKSYKSLLNTKSDDTLEGFEFFYEGNGFKSWRKLKGDTGLYLYRSIGIVPCAPEVYLKFYKDIDNWKSWDTNCELLEMLEKKERAGGEEEFIYWSVHYPFPFSNRDYVYSRFAKYYAEESVWLVKSKTTTHSKRSKENGSRVRVLDYECTVAISATADGKTKLFLDSYEDSQLSIPTWAMKWLTEKALPSFLNTLVEKCLIYK